ncbi:MAG: methyltransferase family protein [Candidatus Odinarchaeota archaeon]
MIEWINVAVMILSSFLFLYFYAKSAGPAALALKIGDRAYKQCGWYRTISGVFEMVVVVNYVLYFFYPLPLPLPENFPWDWWLSILISIVIAIPSLFIMIKGVKDAGRETMIPNKEQELYGGIYTRIRHPQAVGEVALWWVIAFFLHSPFLVLYSFIFLPIFYLMCIAEEKDLIIRHGKAYENYMKEVPRFIPKLRKS